MKTAIGAVSAFGLVALCLPGCATIDPAYGPYATTAPLARAPLVPAPGYAAYGATVLGSPAVTAGAVTYGAAIGPEIRTLPDALARDVEGGIPVYR
jgi:hypothetical protein